MNEGGESVKTILNKLRSPFNFGYDDEELMS